MLILISCSVMLHRNSKEEHAKGKPTLLDKQISNVNLKNGKLKTTDPVPDSALTSMYSSIAAREYQVSKDPATGILQSPNRSQNLRAHYKPGKFTL